MEPKANKKGGDENLALFGQSNKGRGKGPNKGKGKSEESTSQPGKKDLSKIKCFISHKNGLLRCARLTIDNITILSPNHGHAATPEHRNLDR
jgi:hypothetical protein